MNSTSGDTDVRRLLREAADWRLINLLFECPADGWHEQLEGLAAEVGDASLREAAGLAREEASERLYHTTFGPGGPAPPREVSHRDTVHPGRFLAEIRDCYQAFAYTPSTPEAPDHVATEAGFIAYLRLKEAYARACGDGGAAAVCRCAAKMFLQEHLSVMAQPLARGLETSGIGYLRHAGAALLDRVNPPTDGLPMPEAPLDPIQSVYGSDGPESGCKPDAVDD
jgi:hypothetical protein